MRVYCYTLILPFMEKMNNLRKTGI